MEVKSHHLRQEEMFDSQEIDRLNNLPARPSNVSQLMENYDSEFAYIKSLNLP